jgi:tricorn protease
MMADPNYAAYVINLRKEDLSPFKPRSDEEAPAEEKKPEPETKKPADKKASTKKPAEEDKEVKPKEPEPVTIDFGNGIERRTIALPLPKADYRLVLSGPTGTVFIGEQKSG